MSDHKWLPTSEIPGDGDSIWIAVLEWDGVNTHVEYAQTFLDMDGLLIHRYEGEKDGYGESWPPKDVLFWMPCDVPPFIAACPFCGTPITTKTFDSCCTSMVACRSLEISKMEDG